MSQQEEYTKSFEAITAALSSNPSENLFTEPPSPASVDNPPLSPYNQTWDSESGHSIQLDDTPGRERVRLNHRSGTFIEMQPNGDEVHKVYGNGYEITIQNKNVLIKGACNITVEGDCNFEVKGDRTERVVGDYFLEVRGKMMTRVIGDISLSSDADVSISATAGNGASTNYQAKISDTVRCLAGETLAIYATSSTATTALNTAAYNWVSFTSS